MWSTKTAPAASACEGAAGAGGDAAQVVVVADAGEDDLGRRRGRRGGVAALAAAVLGHPGLGPARRAVVDRDLVALGGEMARHRIAHHPESDESDARHADPPLTVRALYRP